MRVTIRTGDACRGHPHGARSHHHCAATLPRRKRLGRRGDGGQEKHLIKQPHEDDVGVARGPARWSPAVIAVRQRLEVGLAAENVGLEVGHAVEEKLAV